MENKTSKQANKQTRIAKCYFGERMNSKKME